MEEGTFWAARICGLGPFANQVAGWKTGLDQVPEISGQISYTRAVMFLDCTNTNVQHSTTGGPLGCGWARQCATLSVWFKLWLCSSSHLPAAIGRSVPCQVGNRYHTHPCHLRSVNYLRPLSSSFIDTCLSS
jgi:hypothetical protein